MKFRFLFEIAFCYLLTTLAAAAQTAPQLAVLKGLAPVSTLNQTSAGWSALDANLSVTGKIQTGAMKQPKLWSFSSQQAQSLRDNMITSGNLTQLADGLGASLGKAYQARAYQIDSTHYTSISSTVHSLISYAVSVNGSCANYAKYSFANATTDGKTPLPTTAAAVLTNVGGVTDIFGKAYDLPAGSTGANIYGNSRPFLTETVFTRFSGKDYFGKATTNTALTKGLLNSPSYPSGHTTYGYTGALLLALMVPERYQQMLTRGAEYGNSRIVLGAHYTMDVLAARTLVLYNVAHLLANDPNYVKAQSGLTSPIGDFRAVFKSAQTKLRAALASGCGGAVAKCAATDTSRFQTASANLSFYESTQTYSLPVVYPKQYGKKENVATLAPEAGYLLTAAFPSLTLAEANTILTNTEGAGGGFLDNGSAFGVYSRLDLYKAAGQAATLAASKAAKAATATQSADSAD